MTKRYGDVVALDGINLQVEDKEYLCIIGPSGCGKTTMIKCIAGIVEPDEGEIYIGDKCVNHLPIEERNIGYVFQEIALFPHMNIYDNICYGPFVKGYKIASIKALIGEIISMLGLHERIGNYPEELSGGARQKAAIARVLISGSHLLLLDEPLGSLDAKVRKVLRGELRRLIKDLGLTAIHVTHDQEEAMSIADRIVVMRSGRIVEVGTPLDLYLRPKNLFTAYFVGEANFLEGEVVGEENNYVKIDINGSVFYSACKIVPNSKKVVAAIRPEFVQVSKKVRSKGALRGTIKNKFFLGNSIRYEILAENGITISAKVPLSSRFLNLGVGDSINVFLPQKFLLLYPYPEEGLEKATSIE
ncbi:MAG: ABC transporter ATP-binding protein [Candidatus Bathyarchaeia archaeon]